MQMNYTISSSKTYNPRTYIYSSHLSSSSNHRSIVCPKHNHCSFKYGWATNSNSLRCTYTSIKAMTAEESLSSRSSYTKKAFISVSDETDIELLGRELQNLGYNIVSTGGNAASLETAGVGITKPGEFYSFDQAIDGTFRRIDVHPHLRAISERELKHIIALNKYGIDTFDIVAVNLYPFYEKASSFDKFGDPEAKTDMLHLSMITGAAKSQKQVLVVVDSQDYPELLEFLKGNQEDGQQFHRKLASKAIQYAFSYNDEVDTWMRKNLLISRP